MPSQSLLLLMIAVSGLSLDTSDTIPFACGKAGHRMTRLAPFSGVNDLASTLFTGDVSGDAGASVSDYPDPKDREWIVTDIGRKLTQRTTRYQLV